MSFAGAIRSCLRKYVTFSGRASRPEYWQFAIFVVIAQLGAGILDSALREAGGAPLATTEAQLVAADGFGPLATVVGLGSALPVLSAGWRRMHDSGRSGLYLLYPLIVLSGIGSFASLTGDLDGGLDNVNFDSFPGVILMVAFLVLTISPLLVLWWLSRPSQPGPNRYGPNPSEVTP